MSVELFLLGATAEAASAVGSVLASLPREVPVPIVVLLPNRHAADDVREQLAQSSPLPVEEPEDKDEILPGRVYLAPPGYHLLIDRGTFTLSREAPIEQERPALPPLFETAADAYSSNVAGMLLTTTQDHRWDAVRELQQRGGTGVVGWAGDTKPEQADVTVIGLEQAGLWMTEMCTSHHYRVRP